jgi:hypothetical protein
VQDSLLTQPHHDGAALHVGDDEPGLGETVPVFLRVPRGPGSWPPSPPGSRVRAGDQVEVVVDTERMHLFDPETGNTIRD